MTVIADSKRRVTLRRASPGDRFDVQLTADGGYVLTKLGPHPRVTLSKICIEKRGRYHVGVLDWPISEAALKEALAEFP